MASKQAPNLAGVVPADVRRKLGPQRMRFVMWWARLGFGERSGAEAARRAGYKPSDARRAAWHLKRQPHVNAAIEAIANYLENSDVIDERWIVNGLAKEAAEAAESKDRIQALANLARIRKLIAQGPQQHAPGSTIQQVLVLAQQHGVDTQTGGIRDAQKFAAQLTRAFGAGQAAAMLAQLGMGNAGVAAGELEVPDIRGEASIIDAECVHIEPDSDASA